MNFWQKITSKGLMARGISADELGSSGGEPADQEDYELVEACQAGDTAAFELLVNRHRGRIYAMVHNMVKNEADAWDLSQEVFIKVWKALPRFEARAQFTTWIYRIAHNVVYDWLRKRKIESEGELDDQLLNQSQIATGAVTAPNLIGQPDEELERGELRQKISAALAKLSPDHRQAILLREVQGMDYKEIGEVMSCSLGTVMSRLFYARKKLQELLSDER